MFQESNAQSASKFSEVERNQDTGVFAREVFEEEGKSVGEVKDPILDTILAVALDKGAALELKDSKEKQEPEPTETP